jgi:hypothetical protein
MNGNNLKLAAVIQRLSRRERSLVTPDRESGPMASEVTNRSVFEETNKDVVVHVSRSLVMAGLKRTLKR